MSNARTGIWSALGALVGGAIGAVGGRYAAEIRPRVRYTSGRRAIGQDVEDAMVIGGASGAVLGAFVAGAVAGESAPPPAPQLPAR